MEIYDVAPYIFVKDAVFGDRDFLYRYWGTALTNLLGYEMSGKLASDHYTPDQSAMTIKGHMKFLKAGKPKLSKSRVFWAEKKDYLAYTGLLLPLDGASEPLQHLMMGFDFSTA